MNKYSLQRNHICDENIIILVPEGYNQQVTIVLVTLNVNHALIAMLMLYTSDWVREAL